MMTPARTQPALLGGIAIGVLSALPVINIANCCCAWILFGGALAAYLMQQNHPEPIQIGDGAIVGLLAGIIGAFVWLIVSIPLGMALAPFQQGMMQRMMENSSNLPGIPLHFRKRARWSGRRHRDRDLFLHHVVCRWALCDARRTVRDADVP